jgi:hypothetical protein
MVIDGNNSLIACFGCCLLCRVRATAEKPPSSPVSGLEAAHPCFPAAL